MDQKVNMTDQDLSKLLGLAEVQQMAQKRYSDALREKRQYQDIAKQAGERFSGALSAENQNVLNPADVFNAYQTFNAAIKPGLTADQDLFNQLASIAAEREKSTGTGSTVDDLLSRRKLMEEMGLDTSALDEQLGISKKVDTDKSNKAQSSKDLIDDILSSDLAPLTGKIALRGGVNLGKRSEVKGTVAKIDKLISDLVVDERGRLKGQGQVSDWEGKVIASAATTLNALKDKTLLGQISEEDVRAELERLRDEVFAPRASGYMSDQPTKNTQYQPAYDEDAIIKDVLGK